MNDELITCSILSDPDNERITLTLKRDGERWTWYDPDGNDTSISGKTVEDAQEAASMAWALECWGLEADWR